VREAQRVQPLQQAFAVDFGTGVVQLQGGGGGGDVRATWHKENKRGGEGGGRWGSRGLGWVGSDTFMIESARLRMGRSRDIAATRARSSAASRCCSARSSAARCCCRRISSSLSCATILNKSRDIFSRGTHHAHFIAPLHRSLEGLDEVIHSTRSNAGVQYARQCGKGLNVTPATAASKVSDKQVAKQQHTRVATMSSRHAQRPNLQRALNLAV
jgi:hypothetical protein